MSQLTVWQCCALVLNSGSKAIFCSFFCASAHITVPPLIGYYDVAPDGNIVLRQQATTRAVVNGRIVSMTGDELTVENRRRSIEQSQAVRRGSIYSVEPVMPPLRQRAPNMPNLITDQPVLMKSVNKRCALTWLLR